MEIKDLLEALNNFLGEEKEVDSEQLNENAKLARVIKDTKEEIEFVITYDNGNEETEYHVECYLVGDDTDTFSIRVYDALHAEVNPGNANEVMHGLYDSDGGTFEGMEVEIGEDDVNFDNMGKIEDFVLDVLFNENDGLTKKYDYSVEE